jgi:uncharacterized DUF497 family protein
VSPVVATDDTHRGYGERRIFATGISAGRVLTCVYTDRISADGRVTWRIISVRPASRKERRSHGDHTGAPR